jgi:membrane-associated phospholipid phosphatase/predicted Ser/Thr protein kinase
VNKLLTLPRHPGDALRLLAGTAILLFCTLTVREHHVGVLETDLFRLANDLPTALYPAFWVVMQAGNVVAVGVAAAVVAATRRFWLAANLAITGIGVWLVAKWIKEEVGRGRPADLLPDVTIRDPDSGLGFVSGHAAVAVAIATLIAPYLGRRARWVAFAVAGLVCVSRVYVGVHLPLDVVGGAALGWAAGSLVLFVLGAPDPRVPLGKLRAALTEHGLDPAGLTPVGGDPRRSACLVTGGGEPPELFVKVVLREWRDGDLLWRAWRRLLRWRQTRPVRVGSPHHEVEHEASMALLAATAGVRVPRVLLVRSFDSGAGMLVQARVAGPDLQRLEAALVSDALLTELWRQVALLHRAGIAHGELVPANCVVDDQHTPWLVDYDQARAASGSPLLERDRAELLAALAALVGPERAKRTSEATLV